jgi:hypothetical protein
VGIAAVTCPHCLVSVERGAEAKFCPRCGRELPPREAPQEPFNLRAGSLDLVVRDRLAFGAVANLYHCSIRDRNRNGVLKVARTPAANKHIVRESATLERLHAQDAAAANAGGPPSRFAPFLPKVAGSFAYSSAAADEPQQANVLAYHPGIDSPDELYTLEEVRAAYLDGVDPRDMAWVWRRLLTVLGFVHDQRTVHTGVTPDHVLIEPREHKLVLIGWCGAVRVGERPAFNPPGYEEWRGGNAGDTATPANDLRAASKTMSYLLGDGDAGGSASGKIPEPAVVRHLERAAESASADAWRLLEDFDRMIEALWGPRQFRTFTMPPRA